MARQYFVDSNNGSDSNDGSSAELAFRSLEKINSLILEAGDEVLLHRDSVFVGEFLHIRGSGSEEAPIVIRPYGDGDKKAVIDAQGSGQWFQDFGLQLDSDGHGVSGTVSSTVLLSDSEYIEIYDLEILNSGPDGDKVYNDLDVMCRSGVCVWAQNAGQINHIVLDELYIHDVIGNVYEKTLANGGIIFASGKAADEERTGIPKFNDIKITNNVIERTNRWGISFGYTAYWEKFLGKELSDEVMKTYGSTNVLIEENYVKDVGGDAITPKYTLSPLIQYNVSENACCQINYEDFTATDFQRVSAAIWPWKCKDALLQYNQAFNTLGGENGNNDAQAWDADHGQGTIYQYNYSYGNTGGAVMICDVDAYQSTFRYNISHNDGWGLIGVPNNPDAHIYNNTFIVAEGVPIIRENMQNGHALIENNIFYYIGDETRDEPWVSENKTYDNNLFVNYSDASLDNNAILINDKQVVFKQIPLDISSPIGDINHEIFSQYKLADDSPAKNMGKVISSEHTKVAEKDFFGIEIKNAPSIGASQS